MSVMDVVIYPNTVLKKVAEPVTKFDASLQTLVDDMFETMDQARGIGLAAPQVNLSKRLFIVGYDGIRFPLINPEIISKSGTSVMDEGCLSLPGILVEVERAETVRVKAQTVEGDWFEETYSGMVATVIQHELDHLNGVLITDHGVPKPQVKE